MQVQIYKVQLKSGLPRLFSDQLHCAYGADLFAGTAAHAFVAIDIKRNAVPFYALSRAKQHALAAAVAERCYNIILIPFGLFVLYFHQIDL